MKQYKTQSAAASWLRQAGIVSISLLLLAGCSKDESETSVEGTGTCTLLPSSTSVSDYATMPMSRSDSGSDLENTPDPQTRSPENMATDTHYRVVVYKQAEFPNTILAQAEFASGSATSLAGSDPLTFTPGTYTIFAYSFNTTDALPKLTNSDISVLEGQDFMTYQSDVTITPAQMGKTVTLPIRFTRRCSQVNVVVETQYYSSTDIRSCNVSLTNLNPGPVAWSVGTNSFADLTKSGFTKQIITNGSCANGGKVTNKAIVLPTSSRTIGMAYNFKTMNGTKSYNKTKSVYSQSLSGGGNHRYDVKGYGYIILSTSTTVNMNGYTYYTRNNGASNPWDIGKSYLGRDVLWTKPCSSGYNVVVPTPMRAMNMYVKINGTLYHSDQYGKIAALSAIVSYDPNTGNSLIAPMGAYWDRIDYENSMGYSLVNESGFGGGSGELSDHSCLVRCGKKN